MKMSNMAIAKSNAAEDGAEIVKDVGYSNKGISKSDQPEYPYCLKIYLGPKELDSLGVKELPQLGSFMMMMAKVKVVSQRLDEGAGKTMEIQITEMSLEAEREKNPIQALYGEIKQEA